MVEKELSLHRRRCSSRCQDQCGGLSHHHLSAARVVYIKVTTEPHTLNIRILHDLSPKMLRRPPTAITLTHEDIAIYEQTRQQRHHQDPSLSESNKGKGQANEEQPKSRTRDDRIMGRP